MAQRQGPQMNGSSLRMFSGVNLKTVTSDFCPPKLGSAFILASLGNFSKARLNVVSSRQKKLRKDITVCKRALRAALNPSARSSKNNWRMKTDAEILELMQRRKISRYALEKKVGDLTRATYLYKMVTLPTAKLPRTQPRYNFVLDEDKPPPEDVFEDPYKDFQTAQRLKHGTYMRKKSKHFLAHSAPSRQAPARSPQIDGLDPHIADEFPNLFSTYQANGKGDPDEVSVKHLLPHLASISSPSNRVREQVWSEARPEHTHNQKSVTEPMPDQRWEATTPAERLQRKLPVRYRGFAGARVLHSSARESWKQRDTPSQLRVSWTFPHRQKAKVAKQRQQAPRSTDGDVADHVSEP